MKEYNEYIRMTRARLGNYNGFKVQMENLQDDIDTLKEELKTDVAAPISKYGRDTGGGSSELNTVERSASRHMAVREEIARKEKAVNIIALNLRKIDRAIDVLLPEERQLLRSFYIDGRTWQQITIETNQSYKWVAEKGRKALIKVAGMLFADKINKG